MRLCIVISCRVSSGRLLIHSFLYWAKKLSEHALSQQFPFLDILTVSPFLWCQLIVFFARYWTPWSEWNISFSPSGLRVFHALFRVFNTSAALLILLVDHPIALRECKSRMIHRYCHPSLQRTCVISDTQTRFGFLTLNWRFNRLSAGVSVSPFGERPCRFLLALER